MSPTQTIYVQSELRGAQSLKPESLNLVQKLLLLFLTYSASKIVFIFWIKGQTISKANYGVLNSPIK